MAEHRPESAAFDAWVAALDTFAANLDAMGGGDFASCAVVSLTELGPLPPSLETRATDLLVRTRACELQVEARMHEIRQRDRMTDRMRRTTGGRPASRLLDAAC